MDINSVLFYVVAFDALAVLGMGMVAAFLIATGKEAKAFWGRIVPATAMLAATSFASGLVLWIGDYLFVN